MKQKFLFACILFWSIGVFGQFTIIPDPAFESDLVFKGIDTDGSVNGHVLTSDVNIVTSYLMGLPSIINLEGIQDFTALENLDVSNSDLQTLNVSFNLNLKTLNCYHTHLTNLTVSNNLLLEDLIISNTYIFNIDVSNNLKLKKLSTNFSNITYLDVSNNADLEYLDYINVPVVDLSYNTKLKELWISGNNIYQVDLSPVNSKLNTLVIHSTNISELNLNFLPLIHRLWLSNNNFLNTIRLQNGNNPLLNGIYTPWNNNPYRFYNVNSPIQTCIYVDDIASCTANWPGATGNNHLVNNVVQCNALSNEDFNSKTTTIFPNPTNDTINIVFATNQQSATLTLTNILGQTISYQTINNLDRTSLEINESNGVYFLQIINDQKEKQIFKIIKK